MTEQSTLPDFETAMTEINALLDKMEHGTLTLEQSLEYFERGITLIKHCQKTLTQAEQTIEVLMQNNQSETLVPYDNNEKSE